MTLIAQVQGKKYHMNYIVDFKKDGDLKIKFLTSNGYEEFTDDFDSTDDRDDVYDKLMDEFVLDTDASEEDSSTIEQ